MIKWAEAGDSQRVSGGGYRICVSHGCAVGGEITELRVRLEGSLPCSRSRFVVGVLFLYRACAFVKNEKNKRDSK